MRNQNYREKFGQEKFLSRDLINLDEPLIPESPS